MENVAAAPLASPLSTAVVALPSVAIDAPASGPLASRTTYVVIVLPLPCASKVTATSLAPAAAAMLPGAEGTRHESGPKTGAPGRELKGSCCRRPPAVEACSGSPLLTSTPGEARL